MDKQKRIRELAKKLADCQNEIMELQREIVSPGWNKVKKSLNSSAYYLKQADKQITDLAPIKGQLSLFDMEE